jgi:transposase
LRELVRHRDRIRQDFDDRVRQLHRRVDPGFPEFNRYVRSLDSMFATCLLAECPTEHAFARATPRRLAQLRYDGRHLVGAELAQQLVDAAKRSLGQHRGPVYKLQAQHICQDIVLWRRRMTEIEHDIENLLDSHGVGTLLTTIDSIGPQSDARIIAAVGDPARFERAAAFAAYVGVVPGLRQSGKSNRTRVPIAVAGKAQLRMALSMPMLGAILRNLWLKAFYGRLRAAGKPPKLALVAAMRKLHAVYSVAKKREPLAIRTEQARAGSSQHNAADRACGPDKNRLISVTVSHCSRTVTDWEIVGFASWLYSGISDAEV